MVLDYQGKRDDLSKLIGEEQYFNVSNVPIHMDPI